MLPAIGVDHPHRLHPGGHELGDLGIILLALFGHQRGELLVLLQGRAGGEAVAHHTPIGRGLAEHIAAVADRDPGLLLRHLELVRTLLQVLPEFHVGVEAMLGQIFRRHAEGQGLHLDGALAAAEGLAGHRVDLGDLLVGHGEAARRGTGAMDHDGAARIAVGAIIGVGIAHVERQVIGRVGIHLAGRDRIEALRHLPVALLDLGTQLAGPAAHGIGLEQGILSVRLLLPDFELRLFLEGANQDRLVGVGVLFLHQGQNIRGDGGGGPPVAHRQRLLAAHKQAAEGRKHGDPAGQTG